MRYFPEGMFAKTSNFKRVKAEMTKRTTNIVSAEGLAFRRNIPTVERMKNASHESPEIRHVRGTVSTLILISRQRLSPPSVGEPGRHES